jgi:hypothetical protein
MKYLITQEQLDKLVFKYLNLKRFVQYEVDDTIYFSRSQDRRVAQIKYYKHNGWCIISNKLINEISRSLSLEKSDIGQIIGRWVENTLQMKVNDYNPEKLIFKYLDEQKLLHVEIKRKVYFFYDGEEHVAEIRYDKRTGATNVRYDGIGKKIGKLFPSDNWADIVCRWVHHTLKLAAWRLEGGCYVTTIYEDLYDKLIIPDK